MLDKQFIQDYFNADFRDIDSLLNDVLVPIFGSFDPGYDEITLSRDAKEKAAQSRIKKIKHVATLPAMGMDIKVFDVTLDSRCHIHRARKGIQTLIRQYVEKFEGAFIVFHYEDPANRSWRFSYLEKRESNVASTNAKRYTYLCGKQYPCRTLAERFEGLQKQDLTAINLEKAFSVETLSDEFFNEYRNFYQDLVNFVKYEDNLIDGFVEYAKGDKELAEKYARDYIKKLMGRLVFIQFLQNKAWLKEDIHYTHTLFNSCTEEQKYDFLDNVLEPLFFGVFNTPKDAREVLFHQEHWDMNLYNEWKDFPYLNGGLFECDELDKLSLPLPSYFFSNPGKEDKVRKPNDEFYSDACGIFDFFDRYNFTIDESDPLDREIGVDPEMLGKIFENLLEDNKDKGAFYTPKEIVDYMCKEALTAYLIDEARKKSEVNKQRQENFEDAIRAFVNDPEMTVKRIQQYDDKQLIDLDESLRDVKICDPAIGSGAFPMGLLNLLMACRTAVNDALRKGEPRYLLKKEIIQNNIYGVDIEKGAIDIARLRFWLSIVVDLEEPEALPNFDYKFMQGNSLLEQYQGVDLSTLTQNKKEQHEALQVSMFDDQLDILRKTLRKYLDDYFLTTDHQIKTRLRQQIKDNVNQQLHEQHIRVDFPEQYDIAANTDFFLWHTWFADVFNRPSKQGFDIIIGNPPYIGEKGHKELFTPIKQDASLKKFYLGKMDYFYFFFHLALNNLRVKGVCALITTNYYPTAKGAKKLRQDFEERANILQLINFNEYKIFESALGQHNLITILEKSTTHNTRCKLLNTSKKGYVRRDHVQSILDGTDESVRISYIDQSDLYEGVEKYVRLLAEEGANSPLTSVFHKLSNKNDILGNIANVNAGIMGGCDSLTNHNLKYISTDYIIENDLQKDDGVIVLDSANERDLVRYNALLDKSFFQDFYKNSDIRKYYTSCSTTKKIIFSSSANSEQVKNEIKIALARFKPILKKIREINNEKLEEWYLIRRGAAHPQIFNAPKIVAPQRSKTNTFGYNEIPWYASADVYFITEPKEGYQIKYILGLLNSKLYYVWLYNKGKRKGDSLELYQKPLSEIPIKQASFAQQQPIISLVDKILAAKQVDPETDTSEWERQIDKLVYDLYGLDDTERKLIEGE